jgi:hypothetical protein
MPARKVHRDPAANSAVQYPTEKLLAVAALATLLKDVP